LGDTYDGQEIIQISRSGVVTPYAGAHLVREPVANENTVVRVDTTPPTPTSSARFNWPNGMLTLGGTGYIAEYANHNIRTITGEPSSARKESWGRIKALYRHH